MCVVYTIEGGVRYWDGKSWICVDGLELDLQGEKNNGDNNEKDTDKVT